MDAQASLLLHPPGIAFLSAFAGSPGVAHSLLLLVSLLLLIFLLWLISKLFIPAFASIPAVSGTLSVKLSSSLLLKAPLQGDVYVPAVAVVTAIFDMSVIADFPPVSGAPAFAVSLHDPILIYNTTVFQIVWLFIFSKMYWRIFYD